MLRKSAMKMPRHLPVSILLVSIVVAAVLVLAVQQISSTFLIGKDGRIYFFGSDNQALRDQLCETGDLKRIVEDANLASDTGVALYRHYCVEFSPEKIRTFYGSLPGDKRRNFRRSFERHGYEVNKITC